MGGAAEVGVYAGGMGLVGGRMRHWLLSPSLSVALITGVGGGCQQGLCLRGGGGGIKWAGVGEGLVVEEAMDKLCPVFFVQCFLKPILDRTVVVDDNFKDFCKE